MQTVSLSSRQHSAELFLIGTREIEPAHPGTGVYVFITEAYPFRIGSYGLEHGLVRIDALVLLVHVGDLDRLSYIDASLVRSVKSHYKTEKRSLTRTVRAYHAHDSSRRKDKRQVFEEQFVSVSLAHIMELDDLVPEMRTVRDVDFQIGLLLPGIGRSELLIGSQTGFLLGLAGLRGHPDPFKLSFESLAALALLLFFHSQALALLVQPARVIALPRNTFTAIEFQNPTGYVIQEISVVGDGYDRTLVLLQVALQPLNTLGIEVVGRLVEKKHVRLAKKKSAQRHTASFPSRQRLYERIGRRALESVHRTFQLGVYLPAVHMLDLLRKLSLTLDKRGHLLVGKRLAELHTYLVILCEYVHHFLNAFLDHFQHSLVRVHLRLLLQITHGITRGPHDLALVGFLHPCDDLQKCGLSGTVQTYDAYLGPVEK